MPSRRSGRKRSGTKASGSSQSRRWRCSTQGAIMTIEPRGILRSPIRSSRERRPAHDRAPADRAASPPRSTALVKTSRESASARGAVAHAASTSASIRARAPGVLRQEVERPGQGVRGGLVTGADEGDDVGADLDVGEAAPGLRIGAPRGAASGDRSATARPGPAAPDGRRSARRRPPRRSAAPAGRADGRSAAASSGRPKTSSGSSGPSASK